MAGDNGKPRSLSLREFLFPPKPPTPLRPPPATAQPPQGTPPLRFLEPYLTPLADFIAGVLGQKGDPLTAPPGSPPPSWPIALGAMAGTIGTGPGKVLKKALTIEDAADAAKATRKGIRAYHGSPHDFEKFELSPKTIGTGEGAQAYGHGLYFAEGEGTAKYYKQALSRGFEYQGQPVDPRSSLGRTLDFLRTDVKSGEAMTEALPRRVQELRKHAEFMRQYEPGYGSDAMYDRAADQLATLDPTQLKPAGKMYEVDIKADPEHFLDWDAPVETQSDAVREAVARAWGKTPEEFARDVAPGARGSQLYSRAGHGDPQQATEVLRRAGIPGIKYLDQGSRATSGGELIDVFKGPEGWQSKIRMNRASGEQYFTTSAPHATREAAETWAQSQIAKQGTRNFTVFDDALIDILRKYGFLPPIAGLGALSQVGQPKKAEAR